MKKLFPLLLFFCFCMAFTGKATAQDTTYISPGSSWKYRDNGSDQGTTWRTFAFNDSSWLTGNAEFGYGDGGEATLLNACGTVAQNPSCSNKYITTYFRKLVYISDTSLYRHFIINLVRDDGAVVYVNDSEVVRSNMPAGTISYTTLAPTAIGGAAESAWNSFTTETRFFKRGWNIIAVEIHQESGTSSDVSFNFELKGIRKPATALQFNGSSQHVTFGTALPLNASTFTLECWFRRTATGSTTSTGTGGVTAVPLIAKGRGESDGSNLDLNYFFGINSTGNVLCADFEEGTGQASPGLNHPVSGVTAISNNQWYHGAVTYDGQKWRLYLNGALEKTDSVGRLPQFLSIQHASLATAMTSTGTAQGRFGGEMDEVRIWNYARSQQQIAGNMNTEITDTTGLLGYYRMNDSTGTILKNSGSTTINGTLVGTPLWVSGSPFNAISTPLNFPPTAGSITTPADTSANYGSTTLGIGVSDPENHSLQVTFYGRQRPVQDSPIFTIIPLPDTQFYTQQANGGNNSIFKAQTNWIVNNKSARNIKYLIQLGDCVQNGDNNGNPVEWQRADTSMSILENPVTTQLAHGLAYGICVGNHDQGATGDGSGRNGSSTFYNQYFGKTRFAGRPYYGGSSDPVKNNNHFQFFSASGMNFISISFEYDTNMDTLVLRWADSLLKAYPTHRGIVNSHWIINSDASFGAQGQAIYNRLKNNANLHFMLCGHINPNGEARRTDVFNSNTVHTLLSDYQDRTNGGNGWLRIMEFRPSEDKVYVYTYSPTLNQFETDANSQFTLDYNMGGSFTNLGTVNVPSGSTASISWPGGLQNNTKYDWYAVISDSVNAITSRAFKFSNNPVPVITSPNGGEFWKAASTRTVTFYGKYIRNMKLEYSTNGSSWTPVSTSVNGNSFTWTLPLTASPSYRLKLTDTTGGGTRFDTTNATFTIYSDSFITAGSNWKYKDDGSNQGTTWVSNSFNDSLWASGNAEFGYGDGGEITLVNACGTVTQNPSCSNKYITTYFRKRIYIEDITRYSQFKLGVVRDDGVAVYVNGNEVYRDNLTTGTIAYNTLAPVAIGGADESAWQLSTIPTTGFTSGWNTIAVEIHQQAGSSSDLSFDCRLWGDTVPLPAVAMIFPNGGEKLNMGAHINIRWSANTPKVKLEYSVNGGSNWNLIATGITGSSGQYTWQVPNISTTNGLIRLSDSTNVSVNDLSNSPFSIGTDTLINLGYHWKYRDLGTSPGASWKDSIYNDSSWASGPSELGYGDGGEATVVSFGPSSTNKYRTTYFRRNIFIPNAARYTYYKASVVRDDGAVIYVNGQEVWRDRMPAGIITDSTFANVTTDGASETALNNFNITQAGLFVSGWNTIAVEIHQVNATSSDISFNMRLTGDTIPIAPVVIQTPNGGELVYSNSPYNITWTNNTLSGKVKLEYSTNTGNTWNFITNTVAASAQTYAWSVPNISSSNCLIRISDSANTTLADTSNSIFSIIAAPAPFNPCATPNHIGCFTSVQPSAQTPLLVYPTGTHTFQRIIKTGDPLTFGGTLNVNNDFTNYVPINGSSKRGALAINHETDPGGVSIIYISFNDSTGLWRKDSSGAVNFGAAGLVKTARNCSGGLTPWMTTVTSEETYTTGDANADGYEDIGWHIEIDPLTRQVKDYNNDGIKDKLWAMGRMSHENVVFKNDSLTAYFGEDGGSQGVYKFVAFQKMRMDSGTLYVLQRNGSSGNWIVVPNTTQAQRNTVSSVISGLGGTNFNGVEDVEINPLNGMIYFTSKGNSIIYRFTDNGTTVSNFENYVGNNSVNYNINYGSGSANESWATGNDNLAFDDLGNLWVNQDGSRNHWWVVRPDHTPANPKVELFATTPSGSEPTGLTFTPDFKYGFISFQHPGSNTQKQVDAAGDSIQFNTHTTIVFANKNNLGTLAALPVELVDFNLKKAGKNNVNIFWSTASETNNDFFTVERSLNGADFITVEKVKGAGNSSTIKHYLVTDMNQPLTTIYYRIRQTDLDGKTSYSSIKSINLSEKAVTFNLTDVFPNPFTNDIQIMINSINNREVDLIISDISGKEVYHKSATLKTGDNKIILNLEHLNQGTYFLNLRSGGDTQTIKILK